MSRNATSRAETDRPDIFQDVTDSIIAELEAGCLPWVQPWSDETVALAMPCNVVTERSYSGVNVMLLWRAAKRAGYRSRYWLTFRQAIEAGGTVRKGERGTTAVFGRRVAPAASQQGVAEAGDKPKLFGFLRRFTLFNAQQCDGLDPRFGPEVEPDNAPEGELIERSERLIAASGVAFTLGAVEAFYSQYDDMVHLPSWRRFQDPIDRERICLHELVHATGHSSRLGRDLSNAFGSDGYAREELIAELGAAFVCASLGIPPTVRHANYLNNWLEVLRADKRAIFKAASAATKAANWLLDRHAARAVEYEKYAPLEEAEEHRSAAATS
ncbi:MAG: zincin-like metallopeptidase domain-containing protein [Sphingomonas sp.]